jgi:hypothetical protein
MHSKSGALRVDAKSTLADLSGGEGETAAFLQTFDFAGTRAAGNLDVSVHKELQYQLFTHMDPVPILSELAAQGFRIYRVGTRINAYGRMRIFDFLDDYAAGRAPRYGINRSLATTVSGNWSTGPGCFICYPLLCHLQPMVMLVRTASGAELAILPPEGTGFKRAQQLSGWPSGYVGASIQGSGSGLYKSATNLWKADAPQLLFDQCVSAANSLFNYLSSPEEWVTASGEFDANERWITWASVTQGIEALTSLALDWTGPSSIWDAFRALTILLGVWQGGNSSTPKLRECLHPDRIRAHVIPRLVPGAYRAWATDIVGNWENQLRTGFPNSTLDEAVARVEDLRHLVHGVGASPKRRTDRLQALRVAEENRPGLQLVSDVATLWWTAVLLEPKVLCRPGQLPW